MFREKSGHLVWLSDADEVGGGHERQRATMEIVLLLATWLCSSWAWGRVRNTIPNQQNVNYTLVWPAPH